MNTERETGNVRTGFAGIAFLLVVVGGLGFWLGRKNTPAASGSIEPMPAARTSAPQNKKEPSEAEWVVGEQIHSILMPDAIMTPSGDVYIEHAFKNADDSYVSTIWLLRQDEAVKVRVVEKLSSDRAAPATQSALMANQVNSARRLSSLFNSKIDGLQSDLESIHQQMEFQSDSRFDSHKQPDPAN